MINLKNLKLLTLLISLVITLNGCKDSCASDHMINLNGSIEKAKKVGSFIGSTAMLDPTDQLVIAGMDKFSHKLYGKAFLVFGNGQYSTLERDKTDFIDEDVCGFGFFKNRSNVTRNEIIQLISGKNTISKQYFDSNDPKKSYLEIKSNSSEKVVIQEINNYWLIYLTCK